VIIKTVSVYVSLATKTEIEHFHSPHTHEYTDFMLTGDYYYYYYYYYIRLTAFFPGQPG